MAIPDGDVERRSSKGDSTLLLAAKSAELSHQGNFPVTLPSH
jgi:hypothetical protein